MVEDCIGNGLMKVVCLIEIVAMSNTRLMGTIAHIMVDDLNHLAKGTLSNGAPSLAIS